MEHRLRPLQRPGAGIAATLAAAALLAIGCAGPRIVVELDEAGLRGWEARSPSWSWAPDAEPWVEAPADLVERAGPRLAALVSRALGARGLVHAETNPDVLVRYHLEIRRTELVTYEELPPRSITGSLVRGQYVVQGVTRVVREYDDVRLELRVARASDGRPLWTVRLRERLPKSTPDALDAVVASAFERFPEAPAARDTATATASR